tara:strand:- start:54 stop:587 length:534 start_codon:yes stop_codon:yes gene_type:complete
MIISCNSCGKKFVVPDKAISESGRLVQCSACGNKWTQFPIGGKTKTAEKVSKIKPIKKNIENSTKKIKSTKSKKAKVKKKTGPDLYSPEYLAKKHGIKIGGEQVIKSTNIKIKDKVNLGFYSTLIISIIVIITFLRVLYFGQDFLKEIFPVSEIYLDYLFETIRNIKDIIENFILGY